MSHSNLAVHQFSYLDAFYMLCMSISSITGDKWCSYWFGVLPDGTLRVVAAVES